MSTLEFYSRPLRDGVGRDVFGSAFAHDCGTSRSLVVAIRLSVYVLPLLEDVASLIVARGLGIDKGWVS